MVHGSFPGASLRELQIGRCGLDWVGRRWDVAGGRGRCDVKEEKERFGLGGWCAEASWVDS